jgi:hypothetical protein
MTEVMHRMKMEQSGHGQFQKGNIGGGSYAPHENGTKRARDRELPPPNPPNLFGGVGLPVTIFYAFFIPFVI